MRSHHRWYLSQSLDVRDFRVQVVSDTTGGFENDSYPLLSWEMCSTEDMARSNSPWMNTLLKMCTVLYSNSSNAVCLWWILRLLYCFAIWLSLLAMSERNTKRLLWYQQGQVQVFVSVIKFSWTNGLITLVAMICMSWVSPAVLIRGQSLWQCCCHQVVHWGTSSVNEARCLACPKTSHTDTCMYNTVSTLTWLFFLSALQMEQLQTCLESILERHSTHAAKWIIY